MRRVPDSNTTRAKRQKERIAHGLWYLRGVKLPDWWTEHAEIEELMTVARLAGIAWKRHVSLQGEEDYGQ